MKKSLVLNVQTLVLNVQTLVLNVQTLVLNVHLLYVQNQALKPYSNAFPCSDFITMVHISDRVKYLPFIFKSIRKSVFLKD